MIVLLRNQFPGRAPASAVRRASIASTQARIKAELSRLNAPHLHAYKFVDAISATVSKAEAARLRGDPAVRAVVPDTLVRGPDTASPLSTATGPSMAAPFLTPLSTDSPTTDPQAICPADPSQPLLEPEALQSMNVDTGSAATGSGVRIAVFPDGLDPNNPDFISPDSSHAIFDYQDFTGSGPNAATGGAEAFGDASSIIAQGTQVFDLSGEVNPAHPLPPGCNIRIRGVAPGASLAVMKVFGSANFAFTSEILQGVDYAVNTDHVDILSESFGGNPVPNPGDPIAVADEDAVNAGITVVVSSGDAGATNTIGSPAVAPDVISVGATTDYQLYGQTISYGAQLGSGGWESDQISALSSSGVTEANRTVDVVAPGESGWADCSTDTSTYFECADPYHGSNPPPIQPFGGTSESAPLTAGAAALVIQAYRGTHSGTSPSPGLVKQILMSTSRDIDSRAADQGAGLVDALRAVQAAESLGNLTKTGNALLYSPNAINSIAPPNHHSTTNVTVTNDGASSRTVSPSVRALGAPTTIASGTLTLGVSDPTFVDQTGQPRRFQEVHISVPAGTDRLHAALAWDSSGGDTVRFTLFDPQGAIVLHSRPQGNAEGFSEGEVHDAQAGTWTMLVFPTTAYAGNVAYQVTSQSFHSVQGSVQPASATIAPGGSATFHVTTTTPATPGDTSESLIFGPAPSGDPALGTVPITLRSLVTVGTPFTGTITGGNGRAILPSQELPYQFMVGGGHRDLDAQIQIANMGYPVLAFLVDPSGTPVDVQSSVTRDGSANTQNISLFRQNPQPGRWSLLLVQFSSVDSLLTSSPFTATVRYDQVKAHAAGLPGGAGGGRAPGR